MKFGCDAMRCDAMRCDAAIVDDDDDEDGDENVGNRKHGKCADETPNHRTSSVGDGAKHGE